MQRYRLITAGSPGDLETVVSEAMGAGYVPRGGAFRADGGSMLAQTMEWVGVPAPEPDPALAERLQARIDNPAKEPDPAPESTATPSPAKGRGRGKAAAQAATAGA